MDLPQRIGPYRVLDRLGAGGMAEVFLAVAYGASGFEKRIALKTILPELRGESEFERLLIEEARLGARLQHRNLVGVHELGVDDGRYYVRMDYVDGSDLATLQRGEPLAPAVALLIAEEVALALEYVHGFRDQAGRPLGLVHRDVSPANILVSRAGDVKLADFGVAKATLLLEVTRANTRKGKYAYMAPEQVAGDRLTPATDQFGLGITIHELLTGKRPFDAETPFATMERIRVADPPDLSALAEPARSLVATCLGRDPSSRFPSTTALRQAIAHARRAWNPVGPPELGAWTQTRLA